MLENASLNTDRLSGPGSEAKLKLCAKIEMRNPMIRATSAHQAARVGPCVTKTGARLRRATRIAVRLALSRSRLKRLNQEKILRVGRPTSSSFISVSGRCGSIRRQFGSEISEQQTMVIGFIGPQKNSMM